MKPFLLCLLILSCSRLLSQHKYYFSNGATKGDGTKRHPFHSLQKLSQLELRPGDSIFFRAGDVITGNVVLDNIHGTKERNIIFSSYGKGTCTINGGDKGAVVIKGSTHFQLVNINFLGSGRKTGNSTDGVRLVNCREAKIRNLDISGFQKSGLILYNSEAVEVRKVYAHENGFAGILVEGDYQKRLSGNIHIVDCRSDDNPGDPTNLDNHSGNGILVGNCRNVLIDYCTATNNGWDMPRVGNGPVGIWAYEADSVIIQHCIAYCNKTAKGAADGGGFDLDGGVTNSIIQYCLSYENWGSGYGIFEYDGAEKWSNNTVRYCISINDGFVTDQACGMLIWNGSNVDSNFTGFRAYNNLFYNDKKYAFGFLDQSRHQAFSFFNNVFVASDSSEIFNGVDSSETDMFLGNAWTKRSGGFAQDGFFDFEKWAKATRYEQRNGKMLGSSFKERLFSFPAHLDVKDPHALKTNSALLSTCNRMLRSSGIDIQKLLSIDAGNFDFFGHSLVQGCCNAGVCNGKNMH